MGNSLSIIFQTPLPTPVSLQSATRNRFPSTIHFFKPTTPKKTPKGRAFLSHNPGKTITSVPKTQKILHSFPKLDAGCFSYEGLWVEDVMETEESITFENYTRIFENCGEDLESTDEDANKAISEHLRMLERGRALVSNKLSLAPKAAFDPARSEVSPIQTPGRDDPDFTWEGVLKPLNFPSDSSFSRLIPDPHLLPKLYIM